MPWGPIIGAYGGARLTGIYYSKAVKAALENINRTNIRQLGGGTVFLQPVKNGDVSEWLKEHAWKVCIRETVSRVRISPSPQ